MDVISKMSEEVFRDRVLQSWVAGRCCTLREVRNDIIAVLGLVAPTEHPDAYPKDKADRLDARIRHSAADLEHEGLIARVRGDVYGLTPQGREFLDAQWDQSEPGSSQQDACDPDAYLKDPSVVAAAREALGDDLYFPVEHAVLSDWLGRERPPVAAGLRIDTPAEAQALASQFPGAVLPKPPVGIDEFIDLTLPNAVARIALNAIQARLPNFTAMNEGKLVSGRDADPTRIAAVQPLPRFLFEINWANTAPGLSWPEAYHVTFLPVYDVFVVTGSRDSPEGPGYTDYAIGWFPSRSAMTAGVAQAIKRFWIGERACDQGRWEEFLASGVISEAAASAWADEVWRIEAEDESAEERWDS
jgi:hypothetical protein